MFSETGGCISSITVEIHNFLLVKSYLTAKICIWFLATGTCWAKLVKNIDFLSESAWFSNSVSLKATFWISSVNCSISNCAFVQDDFFFLKWFYFFILCGKIWHPWIAKSFVYLCCFPVLKTLSSTAAGCIFSSRRVLTFKKFWIVKT